VTVHFVQQGRTFDMQVSNKAFHVEHVDITLKENLT